jgi:hypothetical protein
VELAATIADRCPPRAGPRSDYVEGVGQSVNSRVPVRSKMQTHRKITAALSAYLPLSSVRLYRGALSPTCGVLPVLQPLVPFGSHLSSVMNETNTLTFIMEVQASPFTLEHKM